MKVAFTVLGQVVSLKNSFRVVTINKRGALTKSTEAKAYERAFRMQIPPSARQMLTGPVRVTIRAFYAWNGPDLDCALIMDLMQAEYRRVPGKLRAIGGGKFEEAESERVLVARGIYENDRQVREIHLYHGIDKANPRAEIEVETLEPQQQSLDVVDVPRETIADKPPF